MACGFSIFAITGGSTPPRASPANVVDVNGGADERERHEVHAQAAEARSSSSFSVSGHRDGRAGQVDTLAILDHTPRR